MTFPLMADNKPVFINDLLPHCGNRGFTLIELIAVLATLGFLSVIAISRMDINNTDLLSLESSFKAHIRHAQTRALQSTDTIRGMCIDAARDEYWVFECEAGSNCDVTANRKLPYGAEGSPAVFNQDRIRTSLAGIGIDRITVGNDAQTFLTLVYDEVGAPYWKTDGNTVFEVPLSDTGGIALLTKDIAVSLADGSGSRRRITIASETGFVK